MRHTITVTKNYKQKKFITLVPRVFKKAKTRSKVNFEG